MKDDPYKILGINNTATKLEIKQAYRKMARLYHPDKCKDKDAEEKFKRIHTAYEILGNDDDKKKYDSLDTVSKSEFYNHVMKIINTSYPTYFDLFEDIYKLFSRDTSQKHQTIEKSFLDVHENITIDLKDKFDNKKLKIIVERETKDFIEAEIDGCKNQIIVEGEGEEVDGLHGNLIIDIIPNIDPLFIKSGNDLCCFHELTLYEYLYGADIEVNNIDGEVICVHLNSLIANESNIIIPNKGLLTDDGTRGNLCVYFKIKQLDEIKEKIKNIY